MPLRAWLGKALRNSSTTRLFALAFVGTQVPLLLLVGWIMLRAGPPDGGLTRAALAALLATAVVAALTIWALYRLLAPVRAAAEALEAYEREQRLPELPERGGDGQFSVTKRAMSSRVR